MNKISEYKKTLDGKEITFTVYGELLCPNPMEFYRHTRSYEQIRQEYEMSEAGMRDFDEKLFWYNAHKVASRHREIDRKYAVGYVPFLVLAAGLLCIMSMWR